MRPLLLIFDLDGTLVDSRADLAAAVNRVRTSFRLKPLSVSRVTGFIGDGARKLVERSLRDAGGPVDIDEALRVKSAYYKDHLTDQTRPYPGVPEGIRHLFEAGHTLALLTNKPGDASRTVMKRFGLGDYFATLIGGGDMESLKPAPDGVRKILAITGKRPQDAWMIGDHHTDLMTAKNSGISSALAEYGFGNSNGLSADVRFESFGDLVQYFLG